MRHLLFILWLSLLQVTLADTPKKPVQAPTPVDLKPLISKLESYLKAQTPAKADTQAQLHALGVSGIGEATQTTEFLEDTWLSSIKIEREASGLFQLLQPANDTPFFAPTSTDIAFTASLDLSQLPALLRNFDKANGTPKRAESFLRSTIAGIEMETFLQTSRPTLHVCIDFDDRTAFSLGDESIGRPHIAIRVDGAYKMLEALLSHFIATRNALFKRQVTASGTLYTLPAYFSDAISGYQPVISFDAINNTTTIASSPRMLERVENPQTKLTSDPEFIRTWSQLPKKSSAKIYISKRSINGLQYFYKKALKEKWTNNPQFLKKQHLYSGAMMQLNSSKSGLAFAISSDENSDTITLKSPFPSTMLLWILGQ